MWQATDIKPHILELNTALATADSHESIKQYTAFYGLNFETKIGGLEHTVGSFEAAGFNLVAHVFKVKNAKGTVFLQHGYYDHVGLYGNVIQHCLNEGYSVFTYDLPGHGLSSGDRAGIDSFEQYDTVFCAGLEIIKQKMKGPLVAIGQSTGGAVIVNYLLSRGLSSKTSPFQKVYLLAPLVRPIAWRNSVIFYNVARFFIKKLKREFSENSHDAHFVNFISTKDPLQPLYVKVNWVGALKSWIKFIEVCEPVDLEINVIQGTEDGAVDYRHNMKMLEEKFAHFNVQFIEHGRHHLANEEKQKLDQVLAVMTPLI